MGFGSGREGDLEGHDERPPGGRILVHRHAPPLEHEEGPWADNVRWRCGEQELAPVECRHTEASPQQGLCQSYLTAQEEVPAMALVEWVFRLVEGDNYISTAPV